MDRAETEARGVRLEVDGVSRVFNEFSDDPFLALSETHLTFEPGEFVSVVGPSGCGKSTPMLIAAGLLAPTTGEIRVDGSVQTRPMTDVGIAFQDHLLLDFRTARENVLLQADIRGLGNMLYRLVTHRPPQSQPASVYNPAVPADLDKILCAMLDGSIDRADILRRSLISARRAVKS